MFELVININKFVQKFHQYQNVISSLTQVNYDELSMRIEEAIDMAKTGDEIVPLDFAKRLKAMIHIEDNEANWVSLNIHNFKINNKIELQHLSTFLCYFFYSETSGVHDVNEDEFYEDWYQNVEPKLLNN